MTGTITVDSAFQRQAKQSVAVKHITSQATDAANLAFLSLAQTRMACGGWCVLAFASPHAAPQFSGACATSGGFAAQLSRRCRAGWQGR